MPASASFSIETSCVSVNRDFFIVVSWVNILRKLQLWLSQFTGSVRKGESIFLLSENESTYTPIGTKHSLENTGASPLEMIEKQSGLYLSEDDILRFEDRVGRD